MRISYGFPLLMAAAVASGCGHPVQKKLQGRWHGESVENVDAPLAAAAVGWARGTTMEFADSVLTVTVPAEDPRSGEFEIQKVAGRKVTLAIRGPQGLEHATFVLEDDSSMRWDIGGGRTVLMRRAL